MSNLKDLEKLNKSMERAKETVPDESASLSIKSIDTYEYVPPTFIIEPYIQENVLNMIQGNPGSGKTTFYCKLTAMLTKGESFMGNKITSGNVGIICEETTPSDLKKKIELCGGDTSKVFIPDDPYLFNMQNKDNLEYFIKTYKLKLLVFDPYQAYLGRDVDMNKANEVRPILGVLSSMAEKNKCTVLIVCHMNKQMKNQPLLYRALGSIDLVGHCRSVVHIDNDPEDSGNPWIDKKVLLHVKTNNAQQGKALKLDIVHHLEKNIKNVSMDICGTCDVVEEDLSNVSARQQSGVAYEQEPLVQVFQNIITDHPEGVKLSYPEFDDECKRILGFVPYKASLEMVNKVNRLHKELITKSGIFVKTKQVLHGNKRGISIEKYRIPTEYTQKMEV